MNNKQKSAAQVLWLPILIFQVVWFLVKLMFLGMVHASDADECSKMLYKNPRRVSYNARLGVKLAYVGQALFFIVMAILWMACMAHLQ